MYKFHSTFAPFMEQLLTKKSAQNISIKHYITILSDLDRFFLENNIVAPTITEDNVVLWISQMRNNKTITKNKKLGILRALCLFISQCGFKCYVPHFTQKDKETYIPYIYSEEELSRIFDACSKWMIRCARKDNAMFAMPAIIRLLYSTGVRVSEAINLRNEDIDWEKREILLRKTKSKRQRMVPICDSLYEVMKQYLIARSRLSYPMIENPDQRFFITASGKEYNIKCVYGWFRTILMKAGIPHLGRDYGPRIHDFRHTFAVHTIKKKVDEQVDLYTALPILAVFLGHSSIYCTEKYVRLTAEVYPQIQSQIRQVITDLFPNIQSDINYED